MPIPPRSLSPVQVLDILTRRLEERAAVLERVGLPGFMPTIHELRRFAEMTRKARDYLKAKV